jgi:hypothetical protein
MTKQEFINKHGEFLTPELLSTTDVLMRIASNLSDLHIEKTFFTPEEMDEKLNSLKSYIFDYMAVVRLEEQQARWAKQEEDEFNAHLGRF